MDDDQQFCLRWNNHQSTLVAVFDTLLENGTLVDCTLAAEGKCLNAHKVVLSACSPYFEALLSKHFDKHPILILKDVKFQELKAMMDYMYRGEVNISQDQLGALLKAAESLQIKGLSDNRKGETERKPAPAPPPPKSPPPTSTLPKVQGLTIEQRSREDSREGSMSPGPRKKKRLRRKSEELDNHDASNSSESHSLPAQNIPASLPAVSKMNADVPEPVETKSEILTRHKQQDDVPQVPIIKEKLETHTELMLEPKSEYVEEMNEDSIEDLTLDDDDLSNMEQMDDQAGPSHGNAGEGSSQGFGGWHMGNQSQDEVFLAAQEAVGAHRDSQDHSSNSMDSVLSFLEKLPRIEKSVTPELIITEIRNVKELIQDALLEKTSREMEEITKKKQKITTKPKITKQKITKQKKNKMKKRTTKVQISYHENHGILRKIIRCRECCRFMRENQTECLYCINGNVPKNGKKNKPKMKSRKMLSKKSPPTNKPDELKPKRPTNVKQCPCCKEFMKKSARGYCNKCREKKKLRTRIRSSTPKKKRGNLKEMVVNITDIAPNAAPGPSSSNKINILEYFSLGKVESIIKDATTSITNPDTAISGVVGEDEDEDEHYFVSLNDIKDSM